MIPQPQQEYCIGCGNCVLEGMSRNRPRCKITRWFLDMFDVQVMISTIGCKHDTRSRPAPSSAQRQQYDNLPLDIPCAKCPKFDFDCEDMMVRHDATIRNQTLDNLHEWVTAMRDVADVRAPDDEEIDAIKADGEKVAYTTMLEKLESLRREVPE